VKQERPENGDRRDTAASPVCRVFPDLLAPLEMLVLLDPLDLLELRDLTDLLDLPVKMDRTEPPDPSDLLDHEDALERPVLLDLLETPDHPDLQVPLAPVSTCPPSPACPRQRSLRIPCATCAPTRRLPL